MPGGYDVTSRMPSGMLEGALRSLSDRMPSWGGGELVPPEGAVLLEPREDDISGILIEAAKQGALGSSLAQTAINAPRLIPLRAEERAAVGLADTWRRGIQSGTLLPSRAGPSPYDYGPPSPEFLERAAYRKRIDHLFPGTPDPATGFGRYYAGRMPYAGASMPHSPVQIWPESTATPRWGDSLVGGHQTYPESGPTQDTVIRKVLWDETVGEGRRLRGLERGKALLEKAKIALAKEGAAKAALKAGAKGLARGAVVGAAQGAVVAPAAAYAGHETSRPMSSGYFTPPEGARESYEGILSTDEANLISEALERRKMRERQQYIDEVNQRYGADTLGPTARMDEIRDYLGPIR